MLVAGAGRSAGVRAGADRGVVTAGATWLARDLANTPPAYLTARTMAERAVEVAAASGLGVEVFNRDQLEAMGCGGMIGVNKGSVEPPRMVRLTYTPKRPTGHLVMVGKGVMYDSGGISLKPSDGMHAKMKMDMSGAAAVLAAMSALRDADKVIYLLERDWRRQPGLVINRYNPRLVNSGEMRGSIRC